jgi:ATPase subunit of ABC transporter with duplicated ATPase domains
MAAMKKRKTKAKGKKKAAKKSAVRKKSAAPKKKAPARKSTAKRAAPKRAAPKRKAAPRKAPAVAPAAAPRAPRPGEERVGVVTHYYGHLSVAAVRLEGSLRVGDTIRVLGHTSDFVQRVDSMQIAHQPVSEAGTGDEIGLRVGEHAREHDVVYKTAAR